LMLAAPPCTTGDADLNQSLLTISIKSIMDIKDLIRERRTVHQFKAGSKPDDEILRDVVERAVWAPNHHMTQPWKFYLLGEDSKNRICLLNAEQVNEKQGGKAAEIKFKRWRDIPGWLVLTCQKSEDEITMQEDYASCCCVAQNMMLLLWERGIGVKWTTGAVTRTQAFHDIIKVNSETEKVVGLFWYGIPDEIPGAVRKPVEQILTELP